MKKLISIISLCIVYANYVLSQSLTASPSTSVYSGGSSTVTFVPGNTSFLGYSWYKQESGASEVALTSYNNGLSVTLTNITTTTKVICWGNYQGGGVKYEITITVLPFSAGTITGDTIICQGGLVGLLSFSTAPSGSNSETYQWQVYTDGSGWGDLSQTTNTCTPGIQIYDTKYFRCLVDPGNGDAVATNTLVVKVDTGFVQTIQNDQSICYSTSPVALTQNLTRGGKAPYTYQWESSSNKTDWSEISSATASSYSPNVLSQNMYYRRVATDVCDKENSSNIVTISVSEKLTQTIKSKAAYCKYEPVEVNAVTPISINNWYGPDKKFIGDSDTLSIGLISENCTYYLQSIDKNGCKSDTVPVSIVLDEVKADFAVNVYNLKTGAEQNFINNSTGAQSYQWIDSLVSTQESPSQYYYTLGWYDVTLIATSSNGCADTCTKTKVFQVIKGSAIGENTIEEIQSYPQPAVNVLNVVAPVTSEASLSIYSLSGQKLKDYIVYTSTNIIDISWLKPGTYFILITTSEGENLTSKFVKQ